MEAGAINPAEVGVEAAAVAARTRAAQIGLLVALVILALKGVAWVLTGSVALLSDAAESLVNVVAGVSVLVALRLAARGPDLEHPYGHQKAEYLSSVFEASLILLAAGAIAVTAAGRFLHPQPLENLGWGIGIALGATCVNAALASYLIRVGRTLRSVALAANGRHVRTDVVTSAGVIAGVGAVAWTGIGWLDPLFALVVAIHVAREGVLILTANLSRLMDERLPANEERVIVDALRSHPQVQGFHRLRTRRSGRARFAEIDIFVDPNMSVRSAHALVGELERMMHAQLDELTTTVHVEPATPGVREGERLPVDEYPRGR
jgi:cation diffusion facilitator family transporter